MRHSILLSLVLIVFSCKKSEPIELNYHYNYFPNDYGRYVVYEVNDYIYTAIGNDSAHYFLKEIVKESFIDDQGNVSQRLERYKCDSVDGIFEISDVWVITKTTTDAQKVEENQRFVKLDFPIKENTFWNGNSFNNLGEVTYSYDSLFKFKEINGLRFDSTVKVIQMDNFNAVEYQKWSETYAANVGMIAKEYIDLSINQFDITDINEGRVLKMNVVNYGKEF